MTYTVSSGTLNSSIPYHTKHSASRAAIDRSHMPAACAVGRSFSLLAGNTADQFGVYWLICLGSGFKPQPNTAVEREQQSGHVAPKQPLIAQDWACAID